MSVVLEHESMVRLVGFLGVLAAISLAEQRWPRRPASAPRALRWTNNVSLIVPSILIVRLCVPLLAVGTAIQADAHRAGLFNFTAFPPWVELVMAVLALDLGIYLQHRGLHAVPLLWRAHRVHHSDLDFDASTGLRFHPLEIVLSMLIKMTLVWFLGASAVAVVSFEVLLNATSLFNHANLLLPPRMDGWLRRLVVTPDMHRIHHSRRTAERSSNFGFSFPWWDRMFGTYREEPLAGHHAMEIGLSEFRDARDQTFWGLLLQPLR